MLRILIISVLMAAGLYSGSAQPRESQFADKAIGSLKKIFGDSVAVRHTVLRLNEQEKKAVADRLHSQSVPETLSVYVCRAHGKTIGYGVVDNVRGKTQFITYLAALRPSGDVADIDVLAYRESYGGEIAYDSFRKQFRNKSAQDDFQPGKDIKNISGATISVRAITFGTKRIVATVQAVQKKLESNDTTH